MKVLVDRAAGKIIGSYEEPLNFSVSGMYVVDVPSSLGMAVDSPIPNLLFDLKLASFKAQHAALTHSFYDEFVFNTSLVDSTVSTGVIVGVGKRTCIQPSGILFTTALTPAVSVTKVFLHYSGFTLHLDPGIDPTPSAPRLLYNYDPASSSFQPFATSSLQVSITDTNGGSSYIPTPDSEFVAGAPSPFRLKFVNVSTRPVYMSDWILLYG